MLLTHLEKQKILSTAQCNKMTEQFPKFIDYDLKVNIVKFENFSENDTNLDIESQTSFCGGQLQP